MHSYRSQLWTGLLFAAALAAPSVATAQARDVAAVDPSNTRGFFVNVRSGGYGVGFDDDRDGTGSGFGLRMGYGISERTTLFAGAEVGNISNGDGFEGLRQGDDYGILYLDLGARVHFRTDRRLMPFVEGSVNVVGLWFDNQDDDETLYGGLGAALGGGLLWFVTPTVAFEGAALINAGSLMTSEVGGVEQDADLGLAGVRIQVGLSIYPNR